MTVGDLFRFSIRGLTGHGLRTGLSLIGVVIGVAAVLLLTALGEGARRYVVDQFEGLGTNLLIVMPGKVETTGMSGFGGAPNDLTLQDAQAIDRRLTLVTRVAPLAMGTEEVSFRNRSRQVAIIGTTSDYKEVRQVKMASGEFLPPGELFRGSTVAVLGHKLTRELFPGIDPVGEIVRIGEWRMRVIGVMQPMGVKLGVDFDELALVPVSTAMKMLNRSTLFRVLAQVSTHADLDVAKAKIVDVMIERHDGEDDVTVISQDAVVSSFDNILNALTLVVAAIAAVSLSVAGIGIMNVMLVSVSERTREIGLLKAVGVGRRQILAVFVTEAGLLSTAGGLIGLGVGCALVAALVGIFPALPASPPNWAIWAALGISIGVGVLFGLLPANRASKLEAIAALSGGR
jgi:putative ABC transport system permease protein